MGALDNLKQKVIKDFDKYVKELNVGHKADNTYILAEINFIETYSQLDNYNRLYEFLLNL